MTALMLQAKDASDWNYRGEGAANLVLYYCGSSPEFVGKVLRVQKASRLDSQLAASKSTLSRHECLLWKETKELMECSSIEVLSQIFTLHVIRPLLGSDHIDAGTHILVSKDFLESVEKHVFSQRPAWRVDAAKVNTLCDSALLMSDHSFFPQGNLKDAVCIAVEIKPKCGFLPSSRFINERNAIKKSISRFKMHQMLKFQQKEVSQLSEYDPPDLFSESRERIIQATRALFATPQNNFRVFFNGILVYGVLDNNASANHIEEFEDLLKGVIQADPGMRIAGFLELVGEAIFQSGVLSRLLEVQKLDSFDIEGAIHSYYDIISQPCMACKNLGNSESLHQYSFFHSLSLDEILKIVREYLIAATAKDCSLMLSFQPRKVGESASKNNSVFLGSTNQYFDYKDLYLQAHQSWNHTVCLIGRAWQKISGQETHDRWLQIRNKDSEGSMSDVKLAENQRAWYLQYPEISG